MDVDDELCLCFHVSWRKVLNYIRVHRVRVPSQLADCHGAGTGCGWCRRAMVELVEAIRETEPSADQLQEWLDRHYAQRDQYVRGRRQYIASGKGTPPRESSELDCAPRGEKPSDR